MNRRLHLMQRVDFMRPYIYSKQMQHFLDEVVRCVQGDEDDICELESRVAHLEEQLGGLLPPLPDESE